MEILLSVAYAALFIFLIGKISFFEVSGVSRKLIKWGFFLKLIAGTGVGLIYTYYYTDRLTADTFKFFDDSQILYDTFQTNKSAFFRMVTGIGSGSADLQVYYDRMTNWYDTFSPYNDNRTLIRLNAILRFLSFGHYYVHVVFICFLSLAGITAITKVFARHFPDLSASVFLVFIMLPSVLFWGSGLLKDSLVFFSLGFTLYYFDRLMYSGKNLLVSAALFVTGMFLLMITRFHVFLLLIPAFAAWGISVRWKMKPAMVFGALLILFLLCLNGLQFIDPRYDLAALLVRKQEAFIQLAINSDANSYIEIPRLRASISSMLLNAPGGFITCLTRPFITDKGSFLVHLSAAENLVVLLFVVWSLFYLKIKELKQSPLLWFTLYFAVSSFMLIGMVTPILGAIVRYKAQALPFLIIFLLILTSKEGKSRVSILPASLLK